MSGAFAWVTLLTQPDYLRGVETLQRSLRASGSPWPLAVMVTPAIDDQMRQHLQTRSCRVQEAPVIGPDPALPLAANTIAACYACRCNPQRIAHYPESWRPENCYYSWCDDPEMHGHPALNARRRLHLATLKPHSICK